MKLNQLFILIALVGLSPHSHGSVQQVTCGMHDPEKLLQLEQDRMSTIVIPGAKSELERRLVVRGILWTFQQPLTTDPAVTNKMIELYTGSTSNLESSYAKWLISNMNRLSTWSSQGAGLVTYPKNSFMQKFSEKHHPVKQGYLEDVNAYLTLMLFIVRNPEHVPEFLTTAQTLTHKYKDTIQTEMRFAVGEHSVEVAWHSLVALDLFMAHLATDGPATKKAPWYFWKQGWPLFRSEYELCNNALDTPNTTHTYARSFEAFTQDGELDGPNNFYMFFTRGDKISPSHFVNPAAQRFFYEQPELTQKLTQKFVTGGPYNSKEALELLFEAYKIMVTYTELYPEMDDYYFFR